ncbi:hypothetical protein PSJE_01350 [Pseudomonas jessenii]|uniref:hypothetical protein n=1 Tax=Pseudomonas jessenii TaxID=77298 RepID=UPI000B86B159|nr:hypothetical protein [Pseudomonas jessenii]OXR38888.1 hypothetical protein PSJE_01350 [Pseudomonas jessenii]
MQKELGLAGRCGFALLAVAVVALPIALFAKAIEIEAFSAVAVVWLLVSAVMILGDSITEITLWKASIKRDVQAVRDARSEVESLRDQLRAIARASAENSYILASTGMLAIGGDSKAGNRLEANLEVLGRFVEPDKTDENNWWKDVASVFAHRPGNTDPASERPGQ